MATIQKQGRGYKITVSQGRDYTRKKIRKYMTWVPEPGMTERQIKKELERQAVLFEEKVSSGATANGSMRFADFSEKYMTEYAARYLKPKTIATYTENLSRINQAIGHIRLSDLRTGHINSFYLNLQERGVRSRTTAVCKIDLQAQIGSQRRALTAFSWRAGVSQATINQALASMRPPSWRKRMRGGSWSCCRTSPYAGGPLSPSTFCRDSSGRNFSGFAGRTWIWTNTQSPSGRPQTTSPGRAWYVGTTKTASSSRPLLLSTAAVMMLLEYQRWQEEQRGKMGDAWEDQDGRVFTTDTGAPIFPDNVTQWFSKFIARSGVPKVTVHSLRHTYASLMIADGVPLVVVSKQLGHSQTSTTANIYAHAIASAQAKAMQTLDRFNDLVSPEPAPEQAPENKKKAAGG